MKKIKIGIFGFGSIGRAVYRLALDRPDIEVVVVCDIGKSEDLVYLLKMEHKDVANDIEFQDNTLQYKCMQTRIMRAEAPNHTPWDMFGVDFVIETTKQFNSHSDFIRFQNSGAPRVVTSSLPADRVDRLVVCGVNEDSIDKAGDHFISAGSATTNIFALMLKILGEKYDIQRAMMTSVHAYSNDQSLHNRVSNSRDIRRMRAAAKNIIPNSTPAPEMVEFVLPEYEGKLEGSALNVPVDDGSLFDLTIRFDKKFADREATIELFRGAAKKNPHIVRSTCDPIVSTDVIGSTKSLIFDEEYYVQPAGSKLLRLIAWHDNRLGQASRILDIVELYSK